MFGLTAATRIYLYRGVCDMRKSFDGLCGIIRAQKDTLILEIAAQKDAQIGELTRKLESAQRQLTALQHQIEQMLRRLYDRKSEQLNPNQLMLDPIILDSLNQNQDVQQTPPEATAPMKTVAVGRKN